MDDGPDHPPHRRTRDNLTERGWRNGETVGSARGRGPEPAVWVQDQQEMTVS